MKQIYFLISVFLSFSLVAHYGVSDPFSNVKETITSVTLIGISKVDQEYRVSLMVDQENFVVSKNSFLAHDQWRIDDIQATDVMLTHIKTQKQYHLTINDK